MNKIISNYIIKSCNQIRSSFTHIHLKTINTLKASIQFARDHIDTKKAR